VGEVARLGSETMSRGRTNSGDATQGEERPKSSEFGVGPQGGSGLAVRAPSPPAVDDSSDIDADWDTPESTKTQPTAAKVAPKRVISIGPTATDGAVLPQLDSKAPTPKPAARDSTSNAGRSSNVRPSVPPGGSLTKPKALGTAELKQFLTDGAEAEFSALDVGTLVNNVMGGHPGAAPASAEATIEAPKPAATSGESPAPLATESPSRGPAAPRSDHVVQPPGADLSAKASINAAQAKPDSNAKELVGSAGSAQSTSGVPPSSKGKARGKKQPAATSKKVSAAEKEKSSAEHLDSDWAGEFFSVNPDTVTHVGYHEPDELMLDERDRRSMTPEVRARRARYRAWVLLLVFGLLLLLGAAIALKLRHH
jgi:hypothetical protein